MSDPVRLRDAGDSFEATLLDSASDDAPGGDVGKRVRATLGLGVVAGVSTATGTAAAAGGAMSTTTLGAVVGAKWVGALVIAGAAVGASTLYVRQSHVRASPKPVVVVSSPTRASSTVPRPPSAGTPVVTATASPTSPSIPTSPSTPMAITLPSANPAPASSGLLSELAPLDAARTALEAGNIELAIEQLNRHDLDFPHGQLAPEALALRVEIYAARGDDVKVLELTDRFLSQYPQHPQVVHMRSLAHAAAGRVGSAPK